MSESNARFPVKAHSLARVTLLALLVTLSGLAPWGEASDVVPLSLHDVFAADGILDAALHRTLGEFEVTGPDPVVGTKTTYFIRSCRGAKFWGYCNPALADPCDCECDAAHPCVDPEAPPVLRESRLTVEIWLPNAIDFAEAPVLLVDKVGDRSSDGYAEKAFFAKTIAKKGMPAVLVAEEDLFPVGSVPVPPIDAQLGYAGPALLQQAAKVWMLRRDSPNLTVESARFDDRFLNAQIYMLATTFFQRTVADWFGNDPAAVAWVESVQAVYAGGSKGGGGAISAAAVDPRAVAVRTSNFLDHDDSDSCGQHRYLTDWRECPEVCPEFDPCDLPAGTHRWAPFSNWSWRHRDDHPSYFDVYHAARDRDPYRDLLFVEMAGTHDWINPLGSHTAFWDGVDGMVDGVPSETEERWNFRLVRRINCDHGVPYIVGTLGGGREVPADDLLLFQTMRHLAKAKPLPRIEIARLDATGDPTVDPWIARVRITETRPGHDPALHEAFTIHVALSDDRDFRRCTDPIVCRPEEVPCSENGVCRDPDWDDNREEEDKFLTLEPVDVVADGEFRDLVFLPPPEAQTFEAPALMAVIVEVRLEGGLLAKIHDDWILSTEVVFANTEAYPPYECCPE